MNAEAMTSSGIKYPGNRDDMSIFLLLRLYAACRFHRFGDRANAARHPSINPPGATRVEGGERFYIASTRLKEISNGMV